MDAYRCDRGEGLGRILRPIDCSQCRKPRGRAGTAMAAVVAAEPVWSTLLVAQ